MHSIGYAQREKDGERKIEGHEQTGGFDVFSLHLNQSESLGKAKGHPNRCRTNESDSVVSAFQTQWAIGERSTPYQFGIKNDLFQISEKVKEKTTPMTTNC